MVSTTPRTELSDIEHRAFEELKKSISMSAYHDSNERSASSGCLGSTREDQIRTIMNWIESERKKKPAFLVLGPAGSGKTSLLNTIAEICKRKRYYAAGFFFSGTDSARNTTERLMNTIVYQVAVAIPQLQPYIAPVRTISSPSHASAKMRPIWSATTECPCMVFSSHVQLETMSRSLILRCSWITRSATE